ncbi:DUF3108 domain-containing protein [Thermoflavifilum sp.]|uniref:DUF3108 domain-containing protein n=1 Tax=Thermoflavifilum sp. TaxID=1968839 RepID=UPI0025ECBAA6|nr:DUF3108 domain-containing protein [Thermoflavifilum sp.]
MHGTSLRFLTGNLCISAMCLILQLSASAQGFCNIDNTSFMSGEKITYEVFYTLAGIYVGAGEVNFTVSLDKLKGRPVYHVVGDGKTYRSYDWFYKVRDRYESYIDTATLLPLKFIRNIHEGGYRKYELVNFDQQAHTATSLKGVHEVPACIQDVLSAVYFARNLNYNQYHPGDKIYFDMFLDDKVYNIYIRYLGKEKVQTRFGEFNAIKIKPLLIEGTIFKGGEGMVVWVSDDPNHIPVRIESPIIVGSIKADMIEYSGIRYPFSSLIKAN